MTPAGAGVGIDGGTEGKYGRGAAGGGVGATSGGEL